MQMEAANMGRHKTLALAVTQMVRRLASQSASKFESVNGEWRLVPDDWLKVKFVVSDKRSGGVRISLGLPATALPPRFARRQTPTRWPGWSGFIVKNRADLPVVKDLLDGAFYQAQSDYRDRHGKPVIQAKRWSAYFVAA